MSPLVISQSTDAEREAIAAVRGIAEDIMQHEPDAMCAITSVDDGQAVCRVYRVPQGEPIATIKRRVGEA